ncbi:MAG: MBL fold metallo-hydrolase, partial [Thermodesulfobacteriota bacterium]
DAQESAAANSFGANAGIIVGDRGIIVVDTLVSAREARRFIEDVRKISDKPIRYIINTHYHLDHSFGNAEFAGLGATIVAHVNCADEMRHKAAAALAGAADFGLTPEDMGGTRIAYPEITFTDKLRLDLGGVEAELIFIAPAHSKGSIVVSVPREKVVFAGDILFTEYHPYMGEGDIEGWQRNLDFLATLGSERIIPGHGPLSGNEDLADMKAYLTLFDNKARELTAAPGKLEEMTAQMKAVLPARKQAEWLIGASLQGKYLTGTAQDENKR